MAHGGQSRVIYQKLIYRTKLLIRLRGEKKISLSFITVCSTKQIIRQVCIRLGCVLIGS